MAEFWRGYAKTASPKAVAEAFKASEGHYPTCIIYPAGSTWEDADWRWCAERGVAVVARRPACTIALAGPRRHT